MSSRETNDRIASLESEIEQLPVGYISKKNIHGSLCYYRQWKENGKVKSQYVPNDQLDYFVSLISRRKELQDELRVERYRANAASNSHSLSRLYEYGRRLHLAGRVPIGVQDYETLVMNRLFYVDKTRFLSDWWKSNDSVTLITRPRRFGKTLNLSMANCFFSMKYANRSDLFDKFEIWQDKSMRRLQGTYPTILISLGGIKETDAEGQLDSLRSQVFEAFQENRFLLDKLSHEDQMEYKTFLNISNYTKEMILNGLHFLCQFFYLAYGQKTILLIDEYDTPMLEAWAAGTWSDCANNMRLFFNKSLKTNPYVERALLTGITRISKESFFSDLNHLCVCSMTSTKYEDAFGFTEEEVRLAMKHQHLDNFEEAKAWYNGFSIGNHSDIYNPWSIINFLSTKKLKSYWVNSSSNAMINTFFQEGKPEIKQVLEDLLNGESILTPLKEEIPFAQVASSASALWSLLFASGYLKIKKEHSPNSGARTQSTLYELTVTNKEVHEMLTDFVKGWFLTEEHSEYANFVNALLTNEIDYMQEYLERIIRSVFSFFDVSGNEPERFYHGFVLGLLLELRDRFIISSNRESGLGRYDILLVPRDPEKHPGIILEFKVFRPRKDIDLMSSAKEALHQIREKEYGRTLLEQGIPSNKIYPYGIAFKGKEVWIEGDTQ